jgi:hypothetical protein
VIRPEHESTLDETAAAIIEFGRLWSEAAQSYCDKISEAFTNMEWKPVEFPIKAGER